MTEHRNKSILRRSDHPVSHLLFGQAHDRVDTRHDEIELTQNFVRKIEGAVSQDITFDSSKNLEVIAKAFVQFFDPGDLLHQLFLLQAVSLKRTFAMVRDAQVLQTEFACRVSHFFQRVSTIAGMRMTVKCAAKITPLNQTREFISFRRLDLAVSLPQLRRNKG